jgi:phospholipid/cholesterol/gamma-HCH transport system ATP-binding protein
MIEFSNVTKSFNDEVVLKDVSFTITRGETKVILGVSGSGKSTILKLILGLIRPDSGQIIVNDRDITHMNERELVQVRRDIGMVFQEGALFDSLSVRENVGYRLYEEGTESEEEIEKAVQRLLGFVGLEDAIDKMPAELSGGMKRRVGIARALVGTPKVVLYDEPTAGLDPITKRTIVELMIKLRDIEGVTTVFVTHDLDAATIMATQYATVDAAGRVLVRRGEDSLCLVNVHFIMLQDARIGFQGSFHELMGSKDPYIEEFVALQ